MSDESTRLGTALRELVGEGTLSPEQARRVEEVVRARDAVSTGDGRFRALVEAGGYVGGALVFGGAGLIVSYFWEDLALRSQFAVSVATAVVLVVAALVAGMERTGVTESPVRRRLASTLGALGAVVAGGAAEVLRELLLGRHEADWFFGFHGVGVALVAVPLYLIFRRVPLLLTVWYGGLAIAVELGQQVDPHTGIWSGGWAMVAYGAAWLAVAIAGVVREPGAAGFLGGAAGLIGSEYLAAYSDEVAPLGLFAGSLFVVGLFVGFARSRRWPFLAAAVLMALLVPTTAVAVLFESALAAGGVLVVVGLIMLVAGLALLPRRQRGNTAPASPGPPTDTAP
ncbi:MAG: DUF2157 domain-containing protein, partial [Micromonosporaceae bacterium]